MQSTMKDADPHDIFAIEPSFAPARPDHAAAPAAADEASSGQREPWFGPSLAPSSTPPVAPVASVPPVEAPMKMIFSVEALPRLAMVTALTGAGAAEPAGAGGGGGASGAVGSHADDMQ